MDIEIETEVVARGSDDEVNVLADLILDVVDGAEGTLALSALNTAFLNVLADLFGDRAEQVLNASLPAARDALRLMMELRRGRAGNAH